MWTMGGDQPGWVKWLEAITANYEKANPGTKVKITYYDKNALLTALRTALRAGQGPDVLYTEPDQTDFRDRRILEAARDRRAVGQDSAVGEGCLDVQRPRLGRFRTRITRTRSCTTRS